jgi:excisionase family DNA binding protein
MSQEYEKDAQGNEVLTIPEVAQLLRVSISTVRRMIDDKQIVSHKIRGQWRIKRVDADGLLQEREQ